MATAEWYERQDEDEGPTPDEWDYVAWWRERFEAFAELLLDHPPVGKDEYAGYRHLFRHLVATGQELKII